jgi:hypothetical protein
MNRYRNWLRKYFKNNKSESDRNMHKIWCPEVENFNYIDACDAHCKKKDRCKPFRDYFEPKLF